LSSILSAFAFGGCFNQWFHSIKQKDGTRKWHSGNFLSYVQRSERKFGKGELINKDTRRHMQKIKKVLKGRQEQEKTT